MKTKSSKSGVSARALAGLMALFAVASVIHATQGVMLNYFITDYDLEAGAQSYAGSAESIGLILSVVLSALILSKCTKARALLLMAGLMAAVLPAVGCRPPYLLLCGCYCVFGLSYGSVDALATSTISDLYPGHSGAIMAYSRAVYSVGGMTAPLVLSFFLNKGCKWNKVALGASVFGILVFIYYLFVTSREIPAASTDQTANDRISVKAFTAFARKQGAAVSLLFGLFFSGHQLALTIWIVRYISTYMNRPEWSSYALTAYWSGALITRLIVPRLKVPSKYLLAGGNLIACILLSMGILSGDGRTMCILVFLTGMAEGMSIPMLTEHVCSIDRKHSSTACSAVIMINSLGGVVFPWLIAKLIAACGAKAGIFVLPVTAAACFVFAVCMFVRIKESGAA